MNPTNPFKHKRLFILLLIVFLLLFATKAYYDTHSIEVRHYRIENQRLGDVLGGLKVAHLSDLHLKRVGLRENKILKILEEEKPDLILITGDFINFKGSYTPALTFFRHLKAPIGTYAILGNTEYSNENGSCILCHEERSKRLKEMQNPIFLRNAHSLLTVNGKSLNILGVDNSIDKKSYLETALKHIQAEAPSILLAHSPEIFEEASGLGIDLLLSGHTHGGQIFLTRYLRKIFPLEASLQFMEGFFQKGKMLMYVSRGIGTSFLPFRFGIKPEVTFFTFKHDKLSTGTESLSNVPPYTRFLGVTLSSILDTFNFSDVIRNAFASTPSRNSTVLFDFESESEMEQLDWECHKWFELSNEHATSGEYALKVKLPPGQYPGISFRGVRRNWSEFRYLKMDVFNPVDEKVRFHVRIDDHKSGWEYANRFDMDVELKQGLNPIVIPLDSIRTNLHHQPLHLEKIERMMVFLINSTQPRELYLDHIRLE